MSNILERTAALGLAPEAVHPNERQLEWYSRELSAFIHFGMNTFSDREWGDGTESPSFFDPTELDCRQWIRALRDAGFKIAILTAKHHDGFCLWPSAYTEHSVKNSPYKNGHGDIVREFTDACREFGIKAGIYLSPWDRHEPTWGSDAYNDYYAAQLTELMTNYGEIWECWWDGAGSDRATYDWARWVSIVRKHQPNAVIFGDLGASPYVDVRWVGNEKGYAGDPCWASIHQRALEKGIVAELNSGDADGERFIPAEVDVSIRPGWFYHADQDAEVRTPDNLTKLWFNSAGRNAGILLNIPPDRRGLFHEADIASLRGFRELLDGNFKNDLARGARVTADSLRDRICPPQAVTDGELETFYAPADGSLTPTVELAFDGEIEFNCAAIREVIELGHKVRGFELAALLDGEWKHLLSGECIGNRYADHFETVRTSRVRLKITDSVAAPLIRSIELYKIAEPKADPANIGFVGRNLANSSSTRIERKPEENAVYIQLGGIRPFNLFKVKGGGIEGFEVFVFNGTTFERHGECAGGEGELIYRFGETVDWSYRLMIKFRAGDGFSLDGCALKLFCTEEV